MQTLIRYNPWSLIRDLQEEAHHLFDQKILKKVGSDEAIPWSPRVDIKETADKYFIVADLPGIDPKDIQVSMEKNILVVQGERKINHSVEGEHYSRTERFSGAFSRRFTLPEHVDSERIQANSKLGVLEIVLPKKQSEPAKKIEVKISEEAKVQPEINGWTD